VKLASLFDGIGGALLCAERCGIEAVWSSEIEPFPQKVTQYHFPNVKHLGDITKIKGSEVDPVDIIIGGSPCQDFSVAGLRKGMKHSDFGDEETTRSGLFMEQIRIVKEMRSAGTNQPRFMVWENVPGAFSSNGGDDFRAVLEESARVSGGTISIPRSPTGWANSGSVLGDGFSISWRTIDAQYFGVPQRRRRIYLVADFGGQSAPEILFELEGLRGNIKESGTQGQGTAGNVDKCADTTVSYAFKLGNSEQARSVGFQKECAPTLNAECGGNTPLVTAFYQQAFGQYNDGEATNTIISHEGKEASTLIVSVDCQNLRETDKFGTFQAKENGGQSLNYSGAAHISNTVRRLTPLECERLQGYPDNYTNIPGASDSARYKALGNSFAIPCAEFVIRGIVEELTHYNVKEKTT
jgi:DNA (cytosine-5)-methyltransferase 1